jgi:diamine N-acetyltransferase
VASTATGVSLREITDANRAAVVRLAVTAEQSHYVDGVAESLEQAAETPGACPWYRAVYLGEEAVGFVMISDNVPVGRSEYLGPYFLWRLLIDTPRQGQGLGTAAVDLVADYVRTRPDAERLMLSVVPGPGSPVGFYLSYGFTATGEVFDDEDVFELRLDRPRR